PTSRKRGRSVRATASVQATRPRTSTRSPEPSGSVNARASDSPAGSARGTCSPIPLGDRFTAYSTRRTPSRPVTSTASGTARSRRRSLLWRAASPEGPGEREERLGREGLGADARIDPQPVEDAMQLLLRGRRIEARPQGVRER